MPNFWATLVRKIWSRVFSKFAQSGHTECVSVSFIMLFITFRQNKRVRDVHSIWLEDDDDAANVVDNDCDDVDQEIEITARF